MINTWIIWLLVYSTWDADARKQCRASWMVPWSVRNRVRKYFSLLLNHYKHTLWCWSKCQVGESWATACRITRVIVMNVHYIQNVIILEWLKVTKIFTFMSENNYACEKLCPWKTCPWWLYPIRCSILVSWPYQRSLAVLMKVSIGLMPACLRTSLETARENHLIFRILVREVRWKI